MARSYPDPPVGAVLRSIRHQRDLTIEEAARRAKVHPIYFGDVERGTRNPTVRILDRILLALDVSWGEFGTAVDDMRAIRSPL